MLKNWQRDWPYIRNIIRVTRYRHEINKKSKPTTEVSYYGSNTHMTAQEYGQYIRCHWYIENKLHNIKDSAFQEDSLTKFTNPLIFSMCIDIALNIIKCRNEKNVKSILYKNSLDFGILFKNYGNTFLTSRP